MLNPDEYDWYLRHRRLGYSMCSCCTLANPRDCFHWDGVGIYFMENGTFDIGCDKHQCIHEKKEENVRT